MPARISRYPNWWAVAAGGSSLTARFHGIPTNRSHRVTLDVDCRDRRAARPTRPTPRSWCPTVPYVRRSPARAHVGGERHRHGDHGCAKDIVERVGVPRFPFSDFPLGNSAGRPRDPASQAFTLDLALDVLESAPAARTTVQSPLLWSHNADWKLDYCNIERLSLEEIARRRAEFDQGKAEAKRLREEISPR
jgi:hypothetical protein